MRKTRLNQTLLVLLGTPLMALSIGCGRETKVYPDSTAATAQVDPTIIVDERAELPIGFYDQSANRAIVDIALDGKGSTSIAIRMQTIAATNNTGGFNGNGTGNRAILGISGHNGKHLDTLGSITFDAKTYAGSEKAAVLIQVDLKCDGVDPLVVLQADGASLAPGQVQSGGYTRFTAGVSDAKWRALSAPIAHPTTSTVLVPSDTNAAAVSLDALLAAYPSACMKNGVSGEASLPNGMPMAAVMIALGQPTTTTMNGVFVNRISVGSDVYSDLE